MSLRTPKKFTIIQFKELPQDGIYEYQCVPSSWIKCYNNDNEVTVAYPTQNSDAIERRLRKGDGPLMKWPLFPAVSIKELDSYIDWMSIMTFIEGNNLFDVFQSKKRLNQSELYKNINFEGIKAGLITPDNRKSEASTSRQSHEAEDSIQMIKENSTGKRLYNEDSSDRKRSRVNDCQFQIEPSTSNEPEKPIPARRDSNCQLSYSFSSDLNYEDGLRRQKDEYQMENSSTHKSKSSTSVQQIDNPSLIRLRKLCKQMTPILNEILDLTRDRI